jgi:hypothetical protein
MTSPCLRVGIPRRPPTSYSYRRLVATTQAGKRDARGQGIRNGSPPVNAASRDLWESGLDRWLLYVTGGLAYRDLESSFGLVTVSKTKAGWVVGAGVEAALWDRLGRERSIEAITFADEHRNAPHRAGLNRVMAKALPRHIRASLDRAEEAERKASEEADPQARAELLILADCWRKVAADYEHVEKLESFLSAHEVPFAARWRR